MKQTMKIKICIFIIIAIALSLQAAAFCAVRGYVFDKNGNPVTNGINVNATNLDNGVPYPASVEGGFYLHMMQQCVVGEDTIKATAWDNSNYGTGESIATAPYTDINITLSGSVSEGIPAAGGAGGRENIAEKAEPNQICDNIQIKDKVPFVIGSCDVGEYYLKGKETEFRIINLKDSIVQGEFSGFNYAIAVFTGQANEFDIDKNNADDTKIHLLKVDGGKATMVFERIEEIFPAEEQVTEAPKPRIFLSHQLKLRLPSDLFTISLALIVIANLIWLFTQLKHEDKKKK